MRVVCLLTPNKRAFFAWLYVFIALSAHSREASKKYNCAAQVTTFLVQLDADSQTPESLHLPEKLQQLPDIVQVLVLPIAPDWRMYALRCYTAKPVPPDLPLGVLRHALGVRHAQIASAVQERNSPNDPLWVSQENLRAIGTLGAWRYTTGGITPQGDTIVTAILEKGIMRNHPDLTANVWRNWTEIPDNKKDDDRNGFVDDYEGWDVILGGDGEGYTGTSHGTSVAGIIGARGNNRLGVVGVNWYAKLMVITNIVDEGDIIAGHYYVYKARKAYNETKGARGAFVVALNFSNGIDFAYAKDHPLWCAMYDSLGRVGVLTAAAATNNRVNVDDEGDMPTTCPSESLVSVTSYDIELGKETIRRGYGRVNIDLAAPELSYTTTSTIGRYDKFTGTSGATPHVAGAISLMYSFPCPALAADALTQPAQCAQRMRSLLLNNVMPMPQAQGRISSSGKLNIQTLFNHISMVCEQGASTASDLYLIQNPVDNMLLMEAILPEKVNHTLFIYNLMGQLMYMQPWSADIGTYGKFKLGISHWPSDVYVAILRSGGMQVARKFVKM